MNAFIPIVAFYDIHGGNREVLFFYSVPDTTRNIYVFKYLSDASTASKLPESNKVRDKRKPITEETRRLQKLPKERIQVRGEAGGSPTKRK
jgi:hypothetical protein